MKKKNEMSKFHEIELEKLYESIQTTQNLRIQVSIFFGTVNLGALSFGVSQQKVIFFMFAAILFWSMAIIDNALRQSVAHAYYRIIYIHKTYVVGDSSFTPHAFSGLAARIMHSIKTNRGNNLVNALHRAPSHANNFYGFWLPIVASIFEIALGIFLWLKLGWLLI